MQLITVQLCGRALTLCVQTCAYAVSWSGMLWESNYKAHPKGNSSWEELCIHWTDPWSYLSRLLHNYKKTAGKKDRINEKSVKEDEEEEKRSDFLSHTILSFLEECSFDTTYKVSKKPKHLNECTFVKLGLTYRLVYFTSKCYSAREREVEKHTFTAKPNTHPEKKNKMEAWFLYIMVVFNTILLRP